ncbi:uncharacterized protein [Triticum aestivum]|uniref:uncharacterized protein isoform X2 n=1 Tax=Triticum aestivum TaxID=4565 RepID=UPI0008437A02|nr:uncharacterized protein LOC123142917 isoform X2 [Triticum aestivum]
MAIVAASVWAVAVVGWLVSPIITLLLRKMLSRLGFDASHKLLELEIRIVPELKETRRALCQQSILAAKQETATHIKFKKKFGPVVLQKMVQFGRMEAMLVHALEDAEDIFHNQQEIKLYRSRCWHGLYRVSASCIARFKSRCLWIARIIVSGSAQLLHRAWKISLDSLWWWWSSCWCSSFRNCCMSIFYWLVHATEAAHTYRNWSYDVVGITGYQENASMLDILLITISRRNLKKRIEKIESTVSDVKESLLVLSVARKRASQFLADCNDNASEEDTNEYDGNASEEDTNEYDGNASEEDSNEYDGNASEEDSNEYDGSASEENSNESDGNASEGDSNESDGTASEEHSNQSGASQDSLTLDLSAGGYKLKQLRDISKLHFNLEIYGLEKVKSTDEALEVNLAAKFEVIKLTLDWGDADDGTRCSPEVEAEILEVLCPPVRLLTLYIGGYKGSRYPDWMVSKQNGSTKDLVELVLGGWSQLGPGPELVAFPHLCSLELVSCSWNALPDNMERLTSLKRLEIVYCDNIRSLPTLPQSLVKFILIDCDYEFMEFCQTVGHPYWQKIEHIPEKIFNVNFNPFPDSDDSQETNASPS